MKISLLKKAVAVILIVPLLFMLAIPVVAQAATANDTISIQYSNGKTEKVKLGTKASSYCKKKGYGSTGMSNTSVSTTYSNMTEAQFCSKMYVQGFNDEQSNKQDVNNACAANGLGAISNTIVDICKDAYLQGVTLGHAADRAKTADLSSSEVASKASTYCKQTTNDNTQESICEKAFKAGYNGSGKTSTCKSYTDASKTTCETAYDAGDSLSQGKTPPAAGAGGTGNDDSDLGCDLGIDGFNAKSAVNAVNPLNWLFCGIVKGLVGIIDVLDNAISSQLAIGTGGDTSQDQPNQIFADSNGNCAKGGACDAYYTAWKSFRNIALGLMVIAGLVVLISQALGMEILDAYTIRKTLPRLLVAAIGITLSWQLMQFFVTLTNDLGYGIRYLIYAPFTGVKTGIHVDVLQVSGLAIIGAIGYLLAGFAGLMLLGATAALALFMAFLVLVLRQIVIIMLIIMAPIGIVAYILPNTQRFWKLWWESFSKALLMFPIIAGFIAVGRVFSAVASKQAGGDNTLLTMVAFIAYFAPYFMIPMAFRFAGGALSQISGAVTNRSQGAFGTLREARKRNTSGRLARARGQGIYRGANKLQRGLNKFGHYTLNADEQLPYDLGSGTGVGRLTGKAGKKAFGRLADDMAAKKAGQFIEMTGKATQAADLHYGAAYAALGMRGRYVDGMSAQGLARMDSLYGIDEDGNSSATSGKAAVRWKAPPKGDYNGLTEYANNLAAGGEEGSLAASGGRELAAKAGLLTSFGTNPEMNRASLQSVAAATVAKDGKVSAGEVAAIRNQLYAEAGDDPAAKAFADAQMTQLEALSTQQRPDLRRGKGIRMDKDGNAYSVYGTRTFKDEKGNVTRVVKDYESDEALESLLTVKPGAAGAAKGEYYDETAEAYKHLSDLETARAKDAQLIAQGKQPKYEAGAQELRKFIVQQTGAWAQGDPGAKAKAEKLKRDMGITPQDEARYMSGYREGSEAGVNNAAAEAAAKAAEANQQQGPPGV